MYNKQYIENVPLHKFIRNKITNLCIDVCIWKMK